MVDNWSSSWSAVSDEEVAEIEQRLSITLPVGALGENLRIGGIPRLSKVRPGTRLAFPSGAVLIVSAESLPCWRAGASLAALCSRPELRAGFVYRTRGLRGLVGWVETPGVVLPGDGVVFTFGE